MYSIKRESHNNVALFFYSHFYGVSELIIRLEVYVKEEFVNDVERNILKLGSFFNSNSETITIDKILLEL